MVTRSRFPISKPHRTSSTNSQFTPSKHPKKWVPHRVVVVVVVAAAVAAAAATAASSRSSSSSSSSNTPSIIIPAAVAAELYLVIL
ncbi:hypothetical protein Scep_004525 [Stephania cephalantha]|uniref:Uncharacterized protein n=1 Tax=Stephania cephalantha TaxID=152367 RepID=A0AAP0KSV3_9MAGN